MTEVTEREQALEDARQLTEADTALALEFAKCDAPVSLVARALLALADENERLKRNLAGRDQFIVDHGLWQSYVDGLHEGESTQSLRSGE